MGYSFAARLMMGVSYFFNIIEIVILAYCLLSFFAPTTKIFGVLDRILYPLRRPFMPISMRLAQMGFPFDVSILLLLLSMRVLQSLIVRLVQLFMWY